jgi:hypothetical protein
MVLAGDIDNLCRSSSVEAPSAEAVIEVAACGPHDRQPTTCAQGKCDALTPHP